MLRRCDLRDVFDGYALAGIGFDVVPARRQYGKFDIPDESVIHRYPLSAAFAYAFRVVNVDVVDQFLRQRSRQHLHLKKSLDRRYELLLPEFEFIGLGEVFAQPADLVFEFQPFRLVLLRHVHETFFRNLVLGVINIVRFIRRKPDYYFAFYQWQICL